MIRAILFDKDGTLTDFRATWEVWLGGEVRALAAATGTEPQVVGDVLGYDLATDTIHPDGRFVTNSNAQTVGILAPALGWSERELRDWLEGRARDVPQIDVPGVGDALRVLAARGLALGILTNATGAEATAHLTRMGLRDLFAEVIGCDAHGPKPGPEGALAFAASQGFDVSEVLVVGDGMTDMGAARNARMPAVAVLTGTLGRAALAPHARAVLDSIADLPDWLAAHPRA